MRMFYVVLRQKLPSYTLALWPYLPTGHLTTVLGSLRVPTGAFPTQCPLTFPFHRYRSLTGDGLFCMLCPDLFGNIISCLTDPIAFLLPETSGIVISQGPLGKSGAFSISLPLQSLSSRRSSRVKVSKMTATPS